MTALLTQCPHCQTSFRVSTAQLNAAHGLVRCGSCLGVFSASDNEIRIRQAESAEAENPPPENSTDEHNEEREEAPSLADDDEASLAILLEREEPAADAVIEYKGAEPQEAPHFSSTTAIAEVAPVEAPRIFVDHAPAQHLERVIKAEMPLALPAEPDADWQTDDEPEIVFGDLDLDDDEELPSDGETDGAWSAALEDHSKPAAPAVVKIETPSAPPEPVAETNQAGAHEYRLAAGNAVVKDKQRLRASLSALRDDEFDPLDAAELDTLEPMPVTITEATSAGSRLANTALLLANLLLLLALPLPWLYQKRDTLSTHPRFAALAPLVCNRLFTCTQPSATFANSVYSQQLLVRSHPRVADALEVSFIFHNDATLPQPFPQVELAFNDITNKLLANRLFTPTEYLPTEMRQLTAMPPKSSVQVVLELQDPGEEAVNYTVKLHPPAP